MLKPNSTATTNLIKAREMIADEKNWADHSNEFGRLCALEALGQQKSWICWQRAHGPEVDALAGAAQELLSTTTCSTISFKPRCDYERIYTVNDHLGHAAVMRMFDRAIELSLQD